MSISTVLSPPIFEAHNEPQEYLEAHFEPQDPELEAHFEPPTTDPDLYHYVHHTPRAREDVVPPPLEPVLPLVGAVPPQRCAHPHKHAWCHGRVHVPKDLHFEFLERLGTEPGESLKAKAGRLVAFYAAKMASIPATQAIAEDAYKFWNAAFSVWVASETPAAPPRATPRTTIPVDLYAQADNERRQRRGGS